MLSCTTVMEAASRVRERALEFRPWEAAKLARGAPKAAARAAGEVARRLRVLVRPEAEVVVVVAVPLLPEVLEAGGARMLNTMATLLELGLGAAGVA